MVNCKNCGAPLSLNDLKCPYCGTENKEAIEHLKKLKSLEKGYRKAQKEVSEEVQRSKRSYGPLIVLVIVLLANLLLLPFHVRWLRASLWLLRSNRRTERNQIAQTATACLHRRSLP